MRPVTFKNSNTCNRIGTLLREARIVRDGLTLVKQIQYSDTPVVTIPFT